ncbi:MAG: putative restriction endonuclease-like [Gemmatimonadetes bacterium]|nr:putative restriction endonuclease-like [Gemmatimonadota bacterium]
MARVKAEQGLLVSWGGFKSTVEKDRATEWFNVRFWNRKDLVDQLLESYDKLDEELRTQLPLERVWIASADLLED